MIRCSAEPRIILARLLKMKVSFSVTIVFQEEPYPPMKELHVSVEGVTKLLRKVNPNKASGPDSIPARILKELADEIAPLLTTIFNKGLEQGEYQLIGEGQLSLLSTRKGTSTSQVTTGLCHSLHSVVSYKST